jgi:hypothetical protein
MIQIELEEYFQSHELLIKKWYFGQLFGAKLDVDIVIIYDVYATEHLQKIKDDVARLFD